MATQKPMTEYYQEKYKHEILQKANVESLLGEVNDLQRQMTEIKVQMGAMKNQIDDLGQMLCEMGIKSLNHDIAPDSS